MEIKSDVYRVWSLFRNVGNTSLAELSVSFRKRAVLLAGLYILCFYGIFQPFQMREYSLMDKTIVLASFSLLGTGVLYLNFFLLYPRLRKFTFPDFFPLNTDLLWSFWNLYTVGLAFFVFKASFGYYTPSFARVFTGALSGVAIGALPIVIYQFAVHSLNAKTSPPPQVKKSLEIFIEAERGGSRIQFRSAEFLYAESRGNYVHFFFHDPDGVTEERLRCTLKSVKEQVGEKAEIEQVHRAYLVNRNRIQSFQKEGRKRKVYLESCPIAVPVSTYYSSENEK